MKNITKSILILLSIFAISCETDDVEDRPVAIPTDAPVLTAPDDNSPYVLNITEAERQVERFVWTSANFDQNVVVNYAVELDKAGNDFAAPQVIGTATGNQVAVTTEVLNGAAMAAGGVAFEAGQFQIRVKASLNSTGEPLYSNAITVTITPYVTYPFKDLYLVGDATGSGWDNTATSNLYAMYRDPENQDIYSYTGQFAVGGFKLLREKGQWGNSYGLNGTALAYRPTEADPDTANFAVTTAGYYTLTVNVADLTYTLVPYDASAALIYPTIGIIGTATAGAWENDTDMTQSTFDPHIWYVRNAALTAGGEMKFRANNAWDISWGGPTSYSGVAGMPGTNIPIGISVNGAYDVWFNDITGQYIYIPVN
ncbi:SusF/SusE family outer membrane protein [Flavobacterium sp. Sd200]|uniref:SusF/SusE family outer membrane protein n=1 Tax=Flavobacterium sp. Sd200 TaxID=2692211 RepID=UPI0013705FCE|nr:SusE domain-containing protein [Flavobacterium sp. Sd200]MXN91220.1 SusF/SusE family outer membrane protein [Flavobacterium sp. Sd200]